VRIRAILFDLDNTLFDHHTSARAGLQGFLRHLNRKPSRELARSWFEIEQRNYARFLAKEISFQEQRRERLRQFLPLIGTVPPATDTQLDGIFATYLRNYEQAWVAFQDSAPTLRALCAVGLRAAVVTNGNQDQQVSKIRKIGLEPFLDEVFSSGMTGHAKPDPEAFLVPCRRMGVPPAKTLYVGDSQVVDVAGARGAGLQAMHLDRKGTGRNGSLRSLADLLTMLS
jgi:putative hydrolase of the HAD superfamily